MIKLGYVNNEQFIPKDYTPMDKIVFCGNKIANYKYLISDNGFYPILIGSGVIPRIWLYTKTDKNEYITLIEDSVSNINQIKVDIHNSEKKIEIKDIHTNTIILILKYDGVPAVILLNLNPVGYNIQGDEAKIMIGDSSLYGNTFNNVPIIIGINSNRS
jgi:hypothetical protein